MTLTRLKNWYLPITDELDKYRILKDSWSKTYLYGDENGVEISEYGLIAIRVPGATRGHIKVDDNLIIQDLVIYEDSYTATWACYVPEVLEVKDVPNDVHCPIATSYEDEAISEYLYETKEEALAALKIK